MALAEQGGEGGERFLSGGDALVLALLYLAAAAATATGLVLPALHVEQFWFFTRDISILSGIRDLIKGGQPVLGGLILFLSVIVPLTKAVMGLLISLFVRTSGPVLSAMLGIFSLLGKWSLADVFILAIGVIVLDGQLLTAANLGPGIYAFGFGALLSWIGTMALHARARRALAA
jgi:paraquat-inducible protein A